MRVCPPGAAAKSEAARHAGKRLLQDAHATRPGRLRFGCSLSTDLTKATASEMSDYRSYAVREAPFREFTAS